MSVQSDAETIRDLSDRISRFEIAKARANAPGATVVIATVLITQPNGSTLEFNCADAALAPSAAQKSAMFAAEASWQASIKTISAGW